MKPLLLSHLCAIYERIGSIPEIPKIVYRNSVMLLIEERDQQRMIRRYSRYAAFEPDRKFEFLCCLAYFLTTEVNATVFTRGELSVGYYNICGSFGLDKSSCNSVIVEIESHTGLFVQSGFDKFEFAHKSIQEFLTAEYIVKLPSFPDKARFNQLGAEMAIAVALSSNATLYLDEMVRTKITGTFSDAIPNTFFWLFRTDSNLRSQALTGLTLELLHY